MSAAPLPTLLYFAFRGRGFASRVALFNTLGKAGWVDQRVSLPRFKKADRPEQCADRVNAEYVTNSLPQLNLPCGLKVTQSQAIARWAAQQRPAELPQHYLPNLYPTDATGALVVDEAISVVDQILQLTPKEADAATRAQSRALFQRSGFLRVGMELLEGRLRESGGPFVLGDQLTLADLYVRSPLCDLFELGQFEGVTDEFVDEFPRVRECGAAVLASPLLQAYFEAGYKV